MISTNNYGNAVYGHILVKDSEGLIHPLKTPIPEEYLEPAVLPLINSSINELALSFEYDQSNEPQPTIYTGTGENVTTHAGFTYKLNNDAEVKTLIKQAPCKNGEIYVYPDIIIQNVSLPCTLMVGKNLVYSFVSTASSSFTYYAKNAEKTVEITEAKTYHAEHISTINIGINTPPWFGFTTDILVEAENNAYSLTIHNFTFYTYQAMLKYDSWKKRPTATKLRLNNGAEVDLSYLTDYLHTLENRIAALENE